MVAESADDDLDSSNVLYDDDFEIEEENKNNFWIIQSLYFSNNFIIDIMDL